MVSTVRAGLLALLIASIALSFPMRLSDGAGRVSTAPDLSIRDSLCIHAGSSDFYGFGVRLGIYLQILSTIVAMIALPQQLLDLQKNNTILLLAILIALVESTVQRQIQDVDVVILLQILFCITLCGFSYPHTVDEFSSIFRPGPVIARYKVYLGIFIRVMLLGPILAYNTWFWFKGVEYFGTDASCPTYAFFFAKLNIQHGIRTYYKVNSIALAASLGIVPAFLWFIIAVGFASGVIILITMQPLLVILTVLSIFANLWETVNNGMASGRAMTENPKDRLKKPTGPLRDIVIHFLRQWKYRRQTRDLFDDSDSLSLMDLATTGDREKAGIMSTENPRAAKKAVRWKRQIYFILVAGYFAFSVLAIEMTIYWNSVEDSYQIGPTGQLIAFVIGLTSFLRILLQVTVVIENFVFSRLSSWAHKEEFRIECSRRPLPEHHVSAPSLLMQENNIKDNRRVPNSPSAASSATKKLQPRIVKKEQKTDSLTRRRSSLRLTNFQEPESLEAARAQLASMASGPSANSRPPPLPPPA